MSNRNAKSPEKVPIPQEYWIGEELDWEAPSIPIELFIELPFWIMVPDCIQDVEVHGHTFNVEIKDSYIEKYVGAVSDSRLNCVYIGPPKPAQPSPELENFVKEGQVPVIDRKCKTVLRIHSACNEAVLTVAKQEDKHSHPAHLYLRSFCAAHIEVVNRLIQRYRLSTYDYFAYEVSPWDVPIWFIGLGKDSLTVVLHDYRAWDVKPVMYDSMTATRGERYKLIDAAELQSAMSIKPSAGEYELLDAFNFIERGDYSGAVRRITTAIEAQLESVLREELLKTHSTAEVKEKLKASENDFPGRLRQYQKLSGRQLGLEEELETTRFLRHSIVHDAYRIPFSQSLQTQRAISTGRWIFNWLENQPTRMDVREKHIAKRSLGTYFSLFTTEITSTGVIVHKPEFPSLPSKQNSRITLI
jgi:hypothetical protein